MTELEERDDGIEQTATVWAVFGDLMSGLLGAFVLILVGVLVVQMDLVASLQSEMEKRRQEEQRRMALEKALDGKSGRELGEAYVRFALAHPQRFRLMFMKGEPRATYERFAAAFAGSGAEAKVAAAAAWSLIHGLAGLILDGHLENDEAFVRRVLGSIRFAVGQRSE